MKQILHILVVCFATGLVFGQDNFVDINNVVLAEDDSRRFYFCGTSFWDTIAKCVTWCPNGDDSECQNDEKCHRDTLCKYTADLDVVPPIVETTTDSSVTSALLFDDPTQQPSGGDYTSSSTVHSIMSPIMSTSSSAVNTVSTNNPAEEMPLQEEDQADWSQLVSEDDEDWSQIAGTIQNLWCGTTQFDAVRNCGTGIKCTNGVCPDGLKCFALPTSCSANDRGNGTSDTGNAESFDTKTSSSLPTGYDEDTGILDGSTMTQSTTTGLITTMSPSTTGSLFTPTHQPILLGNWSDITGDIISPTSVPVTTAPTYEPTTLLPSDITDTLFCGYSLDDAMITCHKRCRSGSPGECPPGETCFRGVMCTSENPRPPPTQKPTQSPSPKPTSFIQLHNLCALDYSDLVETCWSAMECNNTNPCPQNLTCFENIDCHDTSSSLSGISQAPSTQNSGATLDSKQNYCAANEIDLHSACSIAPTCNDGDPPCPMGTLCFGDHICTSKVQTLVPSQMIVQVPSSLPPSSSPMISPIEPQLLCASTMSELELSCVTAQSCNDGPCPSGQFCFPYTCTSVVTNEPNLSDGKTYFCAENEAELKESCGMLKQCNNDLPLCMGNKMCLEYDCKQSIDLCPLNYIGWQSSHNCMEYYYCEYGVADPATFAYCPGQTKFDKIQGKCTDLPINEYCYSTQPIPQPTSNPTGPPLNLCPINFYGWHTSPDCKEYYKCDYGTAGAIQVCKDNLKFDKAQNRCNSAEVVDNFCYGPVLDNTESPEIETNSQPTHYTEDKMEADIEANEASAKTSGTCMEGHTGWKASTDCSEYFWCEEGIMGKSISCGDGLLFDSDRQICSFADEVICGDENSNVLSNFPPTPFPMGKDEVWSDTRSPTITENIPATPPWLSLTRKDKNGAIMGSITICLQIPLFLCIFM